MAELPLTSHEKGLLNQIAQEIAELSKESLDLSNQLDNETDPKKQEELLDRMRSKSRIVRERCKIREGIYKAGMDRLFGKSQ